MKKIKSYMLTADRPEEAPTIWHDIITDGWQPYGNPIVDGIGRVVQSWVKYADE